MNSEKRLWLRLGCSGYDPTIIQLFLVTKILIILLITLPELTTGSIFNINIDYKCTDVDGREHQSIDVTWIVFTTTGLILLQFFMIPTQQPKKPAYTLFCVASTIFYFFININVIDYHCGGPSDGFTLLLVISMIEIIIIYAVMSNHFKQTIKSDDNWDHYETV